MEVRMQLSTALWLARSKSEGKSPFSQIQLCLWAISYDYTNISCYIDPSRLHPSPLIRQCALLFPVNARFRLFFAALPQLRYRQSLG